MDPMAPAERGPQGSGRAFLADFDIKAHKNHVILTSAHKKHHGQEMHFDKYMYVIVVDKVDMTITRM